MTLLLHESDPQAAQIAADLLRQGELVALPTETVYGLGADGLNPDAVAKIFIAKGRPQDNPLILHISEPAELEKYCKNIPDSAWDLAEHFWPGPLTMVLPARDIVPRSTTAGLDSVAVRCPQTPVTREIIRLAGVPIAAPSANLSGKPSTTSAQHVLNDYGADGPLAAIVDAGPCRVGVESTIVSLLGERPRLLRPGGVGPEQLREVLGRLEVDQAVTGLLSDDAVVRAPGMKYKHYAPRAQVIVVEGPSETAAKYIRPRLDKNSAAFEAISMNISANLLGLGNTATPPGLKAMRELHRLNGEGDRASDEMVTFVVMNTASLQLMPTTLGMLRAGYGSAAPFEILVPFWISSACALTVALVLAKAGNRLTGRAKWS